MRSPGFPVDGQVTTDTANLIRWYAGEVTLAAARMTVTAPRWLRGELREWGRLSPYAARL